MKKNIQWKITVTIVLMLLSLWLMYPTIKWYGLSPDEQSKLSRVRDPIIEKILKLGLDLQGGMHIILEVEIDKIPEEMEKAEAMSRALEISTDQSRNLTSTVTSFSTSQTRSIRETFGVGTRMARPLIRPLRPSGTG